MKSVADALRSRTLEQVLALSAEERIALALALGDDDAARFAAMSGRDDMSARRELAARRRTGRIPSVSAGDPG